MLCISVYNARNFILEFEGDGGGSGKDGTRIPHDDELKMLLFREDTENICFGCVGVSHVKI